MPPYTPDPPPALKADDVTEVMRYLMEQLARISNELSGAGGGAGGSGAIPLLTQEPVKKEPFKIIGADGVLWNPGNGRGLYYWDGSWVAVAAAPADPVVPPDVPPPPPPPPPPGNPRLLSSWETSTTEGGLWSLQAKASTRATLVSTARHGSKAVQLRTLSGDINVNNSGNWERCDLNLGQANSRMYHNAPDEWWAHSIFLPSDFHIPAAGEQATILMDIHDNYSSHAGEVPAPHQANYHIEVLPGGQIRIRTHGGDSSAAAWLASEHNRHQVSIGAAEKGVWYDFVHYFRWRNDNTGIVRTWLRKGAEASGVIVYEHINQPTLYVGLEAYMKLVNYHGAYGVTTSVIHDRCVAGPDQASVAMMPLIGV